MNPTIHRSLWLVLACGGIAGLAASPAVIGVARSQGAFLLNEASVPGSATILEGASVRTLAASSDVILKSGESVTLASGSAARLYHDRVVLDTGAAELDHLTGYQIETDDLRIGASDSGTHLRIVKKTGKVVNVAVISGSAEVRNAVGLLVARVVPGVALQLQSSAGSVTKVTGKVRVEGGKFILTDETTKVRFELRGDNLKGLVGKRVQVTGAMVSGQAPAAGASQIIAVAQATVVAAAAGTAAAAGGAAAGAAAASGISTATVAVVGGVAAAATVGGLAAAGTIGGDEPSASR